MPSDAPAPLETIVAPAKRRLSKSDMRPPYMALASTGSTISRARKRRVRTASRARITPPAAGTKASRVGETPTPVLRYDPGGKSKSTICRNETISCMASTSRPTTAPNGAQNRINAGSLLRRRRRLANPSLPSHRSRNGILTKVSTDHLRQRSSRVGEGLIDKPRLGYGIAIICR